MQRREEQAADSKDKMPRVLRIKMSAGEGPRMLAVSKKEDHGKAATVNLDAVVVVAADGTAAAAGTPRVVVAGAAIAGRGPRIATPMQDL